MIRRGAALRDQSLAAIVLDAGRQGVSSKRSAGQGNLLADQSLAAIVLGARMRLARRRVGAALIAALVLYAGLGFAVLERSSAVPPAPDPLRVPLQVEHVVELQPPPPPEPSPPAQESERAPEPRAPKIAAPPLAGLRQPSEPPPPAEAGQVVAAEQPAAPSLDFTSFDIATGRGQRYAGGVTASSGSNPRAVSGETAAHSAQQRQGGGAARVRPVGAPRNADWGCPWPQEASGLALDEQIVVLRAVVRADGSVATVTLVSDPGFGFGPVAIACARRQQFPPATDEQGRPILATSPPIRFRFTRSRAR